MGGTGSPLRHGCLSGKATLPASTGRAGCGAPFLECALFLCLYLLIIQRVAERQLPFTYHTHAYISSGTASCHTLLSPPVVQGVASDAANPSPRTFSSVPRAHEDRGAEAGALRREMGALRNEVRVYAPHLAVCRVSTGASCTEHLCKGVLAKYQRPGQVSASAAEKWPLRLKDKLRCACIARDDCSGYPSVFCTDSLHHSTLQVLQLRGQLSSAASASAAAEARARAAAEALAARSEELRRVREEHERASSDVRAVRPLTSRVLQGLVDYEIGGQVCT